MSLFISSYLFEMRLNFSNRSKLIDGLNRMPLSDFFLWPTLLLIMPMAVTACGRGALRIIFGAGIEFRSGELSLPASGVSTMGRFSSGFASPLRLEKGCRLRSRKLLTRLEAKISGVAACVGLLVSI